MAALPARDPAGRARHPPPARGGHREGGGDRDAPRARAGRRTRGGAIRARRNRAELRRARRRRQVRVRGAGRGRRLFAVSVGSAAVRAGRNRGGGGAPSSGRRADRIHPQSTGDVRAGRSGGARARPLLPRRPWPSAARATTGTSISGRIVCSRRPSRLAPRAASITRSSTSARPETSATRAFACASPSPATCLPKSRRSCSCLNHSSGASASCGARTTRSPARPASPPCCSTALAAACSASSGLHAGDGSCGGPRWRRDSRSACSWAPHRSPMLRPSGSATTPRNRSPRSGCAKPARRRR